MCLKVSQDLEYANEEVEFQSNLTLQVKVKVKVKSLLKSQKAHQAGPYLRFQ